MPSTSLATNSTAGRLDLLAQRLQRHARRDVVLGRPPRHGRHHLLTPLGPPLLVHDPLADPPPGRLESHGAQLICAGAYRRPGAAACQFVGPGARRTAATQRWWPHVEHRRSRRRSGVRRDPAASRCPRRATATGAPAAAALRLSRVGGRAPAPPPNRHAARVGGAARPGDRSATSISAVSSHAPGVRTVSPRPMCWRSTPRRFTATRATAATSVWSRPSDCSPRTVTRRPACSSSSPTRMVPAASVPVTTVPAPRTVNERSTHSRTSASRSGRGSRSTSATSSARTPSRSVPSTTGGSASRGVRKPLPRLPDGGRRIGEVGLADHEQRVPDAERVERGEMLVGLRHPALGGGDDEHHRGHRADPGEHVRDEPLVARHVDERELSPVDLGPREAEVDGQAAALLLGEPVGPHAGKPVHERRLAVIDVTGGRYDEHASTASDKHVRRPRARPCAGRAGSGPPPGGRPPPGCRCAAVRRRTPAG